MIQVFQKAVLFLVSMAIFLTGKVQAEDIHPKIQNPIHLQELILQARDQNPDILAARAEWLAAKKRIWIDSSLPDPEAGYDVMGEDVETLAGPEMQRFMVSQQIPFPVKLYQKGKAASDEAWAIYHRYAATERDVINELSNLYYELYFLDASLAAISEIKDLLSNFQKVAQTRYSNLAGSQRDVAKAQVEVSMSLEKIFLLRRQRETVVAKINALLNQDPMTEMGKAKLPMTPVLEQSLMELLNQAIENKQEVKEMESLVSKSRREKTLAKLSFIPDVNVGFQYTWVGSNGGIDPTMSGKDSWMFPLRINVPLWVHKNVSEIQEAQKKLEANEARLLSQKNTTFYQVKDAYYRFDTAKTIVELYETALLPQAKIALSSDQAGYESGETDFLNLLDSERVYLNAKLNHVQFLTEMLKSYADIVKAIGMDLQIQKGSLGGDSNDSN